jgi:hypothetical protein
MNAPAFAVSQGVYTLNPLIMDKVTSQTNGKNCHNELQLTFESKKFVWTHQYISGKEAKHLFQVPLASDLYLAIAAPWEDELIKDDEKVDLARPGIEQFFVKKKLGYTINGKEFESNKQYIRGAILRHEGDIPPTDEIYLINPKPWDDELIEDQEWVDLARPGKEHFVSKKIEICIIVNGREKEWHEKTISYIEVVKLAFPNYDGNTNILYTVTYSGGPKQNPEGTMTIGDSIFVKNKTVFNVTATNRS